MMTLFRRVSLVLSMASLVACGGSSSSSVSEGIQLSETGEPKLVVAFDPAPLQPNVFNIVATNESLEQDFYPGEDLRISWFMTIRYSDGSMLDADESYLLDASVYLSDDDLIDAEDLKLFSLECTFPETVGKPCGRFNSFITTYAPDNTNTFSTISLPLNVPGGLTDFSVDSNEFLDQIPKAAKLIIKVCLQEEPDICDEFAIDINLL